MSSIKIDIKNKTVEVENISYSDLKAIIKALPHLEDYTISSKKEKKIVNHYCNPYYGSSTDAPFTLCSGNSTFDTESYINKSHTLINTH